MERAGYVRIDADYLLHVRPHLTDREARAYEALILLCDGWERPTTVAGVASITKLHPDHVRKALRALESLKLIHCAWRGARTNPNGQRFVSILRDYTPARLALQALGRISPEFARETPSAGPQALDQIGPESAPAGLGRNSPEQPLGSGRNGPNTLGRNGPNTLGRNGPKHLTRSDPDPSIPTAPTTPT
jgi:hypothetical protein